MNRARLAVCAGIAVAASSLITGSVGAVPASASAQQHSWHLVLRTTHQQVVKKTYIETDVVKKAGKVFGTGLLDCPGSGQAGVKVARCTVLLAVPGGTLTARIRVVNATGEVTGAVTGGSKAYAGAEGSLTGSPTPKGATLDLDFTS
jgi:hypothetical protein